MSTMVQECLPFAVLAFVVLSVRLDRASFRNFALVAIGALIAWSVSPTSLPWGRAIRILLLALAVAMSPLAPSLVRALKNLLFKGLRQPNPARLIRTVTNPDPINILHNPPGAEVEYAGLLLLRWLSVCLLLLLTGPS